MSLLPENLVVYGGFNTSRKSLERVAHEVFRMGFTGTEEANFKAFTLSDWAHKEEEAAEAANGSLVLAHSLGNLMWRQLVERKIVPSGIMALNRTEPANINQLVSGVTRRSAHHLRLGLEGGQFGQEHQQIAIDTKQMFIPFNGQGRILEALHYSSDHYLEELGEKAPTVALISGLDEFGEPYERLGQASNVLYVQDDVHCHDGILYDRRGTLDIIASTEVLPRAA